MASGCCILVWSLKEREGERMRGRVTSAHDSSYRQNRKCTPFMVVCLPWLTSDAATRGRTAARAAYDRESPDPGIV